ncbi:methyltransferase domain-containing protein [Actinomadura sp. NAK00032]|uniref:methyltransferase domain-containing protein n=1 Tax=Actinomadura sp. NAK00032 TaxID=2742128 RepID=UPI001590C067|nr:methyltransferase domain-containing protein [Actinomadura sp. NAK00032]QKW35307.1 methyltransferase domain-containing protein [Actinomadura sp. NAK00032]
MSDVRGVVVTGRQQKRVRGGSRVRSAVLWEALRAVLGRITPEAGPRDVVDVGGGTGGFAVPLAELGHRVTVVDANPDALAALERRAAESGVRVRAVQGDAVDLPDLLGPDAADLVLCHSVLEYVDDPGAAMAALTGAVRPGGSVSVLVAGQVAAALHRAVAGHFDDARRVLTDPAGRWGDGDRMPRRFTRETLSALVRGAGLRVAELHGVRIFADLVPSGLLDGDSDSADALIALESVAAVHPVLRDLATQLHLVADKPAG